MVGALLGDTGWDESRDTEARGWRSMLDRTMSTTTVCLYVCHDSCSWHLARISFSVGYFLMRDCKAEDDSSQTAHELACRILSAAAPALSRKHSAKEAFGMT